MNIIFFLTDMNEIEQINQKIVAINEEIYRLTKQIINFENLDLNTEEEQGGLQLMKDNLKTLETNISGMLIFTMVQMKQVYKKTESVDR